MELQSSLAGLPTRCSPPGAPQVFPPDAPNWVLPPGAPHRVFPTRCSPPSLPTTCFPPGAPTRCSHQVFKNARPPFPLALLSGCHLWDSTCSPSQGLLYHPLLLLSLCSPVPSPVQSQGKERGPTESSRCKKQLPCPHLSMRKNI